MSELNARIRELFNGKTVIAFYICHTNVIPDEWMVALGKELQQRGYGTVGLLAGDAIGVMNLDGLGHVFQVRPEEVETLDSIACFIVTDCEGFIDNTNFEKPMRYPKTSRVLAIVHSCSPGDPGAFLQGAISTRSFDGLIVGFPFAHCEGEIKALWDNFSPPARLLRPYADFYLMGYGYPKLCLMRRRFLAKRREAVRAECICYAPTGIQYTPYLGGKRLQKHGKRILRSLLAAFPEHTIIFRPAPINRDEDTVRDIIDAFAHEPRLAVDTRTSYLETFVRAQVMITDFAHIAGTFCAITHRPAVYFQPWITENGLHRYGLFYTANSFSKLTLAVKHALAHSPLWSEQEKEAFIIDYGYLPFTHALEDLANDLADFIAGRPHPDWLVIRRDGNSPGASAAKVIMAILREERLFHLGHAQEYAYYFQSRPLAVFAIHLHARRAPDLVIPLWLQRLAGLPDGEETRRYGDMTSTDIARLYHEAADSLQAEADRRDNTAALLRQLAQLAEQNTSLRTLA